MDGRETGQVSVRMAPRRAKKDKKYSGSLRGTDRRSCDSTVLCCTQVGTYTCSELRRAGVGRCTNTLVTGQGQRELERTIPGFGLEIIITRATPLAHRARDTLDLVLDCFTPCLCLFPVSRPALPPMLIPSSPAPRLNKGASMLAKRDPGINHTTRLTHHRRHQRSTR